MEFTDFRKSLKINKENTILIGLGKITSVYRSLYINSLLILIFLAAEIATLMSKLHLYLWTNKELKFTNHKQNTPVVGLCCCSKNALAFSSRYTYNTRYTAHITLLSIILKMWCSIPCGSFVSALIVNWTEVRDTAACMMLFKMIQSFLELRNFTAKDFKIVLLYFCFNNVKLWNSCKVHYSYEGLVKW